MSSYFSDNKECIENKLSIFYVVITACCSFACQLSFVYLFARFKFLVSKMSRIEKEVKKYDSGHMAK